jgi:NADPH2:quinone reductase
VFSISRESASSDTARAKDMAPTSDDAKADQAKALGFNEVIDTSFEKLGDGVRRITSGYGAEIVIDGIGGESSARGWQHLRRVEV